MAVSISINWFQSTKIMQSAHVDQPNKRELCTVAKYCILVLIFFVNKFLHFLHMQKIFTNMIAHMKMQMIGGAKSHSLNSTSFV